MERVKSAVMSVSHWEEGKERRRGTVEEAREAEKLSQLVLNMTPGKKAERVQEARNKLDLTRRNPNYQ